MRAGLFLLVFSLACGDDDGLVDVGTDAASIDGQVSMDQQVDLTAADSALADSALPDSSMEVGPNDDQRIDAGPRDCVSRLPVDVDLTLADASETNIHPSVAWDGEKLWLTYTTLEPDTSLFDVRIRSIDCDGSLGDEVRVNDVDGESELDSTIAVSGERLIVGYQSDDRSGESDAIRPFVRVFDLDGTPMNDAVAIAREREGEAITATNWMVQVRAREDGFMAAGTRGVDALNAFQMYAQPLDMDGVPTMDASDLAPTETSQTNPVIGLGEGPWYAWTELLDAGESVFAARLGEAPIELETGTLFADQPSLAGSLIAFHAGGGSRTDIYVRNLETDVQTTVGRLSQTDGAASIAGTPASFLVAWLRNVEGLQHELQYTLGSEVDGEFVMATPVVIPTEAPVFPYTPAVVALPNGAFFVAWSETEMSPNLRVHGRFIRPSDDM
ncbi:MAG: hypothetical protein AAF411_04370 [Myxococcota bacterium]